MCLSAYNIIWLTKKYCMIIPKSGMGWLKPFHNHFHMRTWMCAWKWNTTIGLSFLFIKSIIVIIVLISKMGNLISWRCFHFHSTLVSAVYTSFRVDRRILKSKRNLESKDAFYYLKAKCHFSKQKCQLTVVVKIDWTWRHKKRDHIEMN